MALYLHLERALFSIGRYAQLLDLIHIVLIQVVERAI